MLQERLARKKMEQWSQEQDFITLISLFINTLIIDWTQDCLGIKFRYYGKGHRLLIRFSYLLHSRLVGRSLKKLKTSCIHAS